MCQSKLIFDGKAHSCKGSSIRVKNTLSLIRMCLSCASC